MAENQESETISELGQGGFGFVSLASHNSPLIPSLIAVKSCRLCHSQSLEDETEFLRMCQDSPRVIRSFGVKVTQEDDQLALRVCLCGESRLLSNDQLGLPELQFRTQPHIRHLVIEHWCRF